MQSCTRIAQRTSVRAGSVRLLTGVRCFSASPAQHDSTSHLPRIARPGLWQSLVPRFLRRSKQREDGIATVPPTDLDPQAKRTGASIAFLGILVGSFAINVIALRRELSNYSRNTETKLDLLREVVHRVRNGEEVDVKKLLGTGDAAKEKEWEEMMQELEGYNSQRDQNPKQEEPQQGLIDTVKHTAMAWSRNLMKPGSESIERTKKPDMGEERQVLPVSERPNYLM